MLGGGRGHGGRVERAGRAWVVRRGVEHGGGGGGRALARGERHHFAEKVRDGVASVASISGRSVARRRRRRGQVLALVVVLLLLVLVLMVVRGVVRVVVVVQWLLHRCRLKWSFEFVNRRQTRLFRHMLVRH